MSQRPTILTIHDTHGTATTVEADASEVDVPDAVALELVRTGRIDYATAQNFTLQDLFDLITDGL